VTHPGWMILWRLASRSSVTPEEIMGGVQGADAFALAHPSDLSAWTEWALHASGNPRGTAPGLDNTPTTQNGSHSAPQRIVFEHFDALVPTMAGLSDEEHQELETQAGGWPVSLTRR